MQIYVLKHNSFSSHTCIFKKCKPNSNIEYRLVFLLDTTVIDVIYLRLYVWIGACIHTQRKKWEARYVCKQIKTEKSGKYLVTKEKFCTLLTFCQCFHSKNVNWCLLSIDKILNLQNKFLRNMTDIIGGLYLYSHLKQAPKPSMKSKAHREQ